MYNIVIYCNCHGMSYYYLFSKYFPQCKLNYTANFPIDNDNFKFDAETRLIFKNADLFIYQPMNQKWNSEKSIDFVKTLLNPTCKLIKIAFYRFYGFYVDYIKMDTKYIYNSNYNYNNFYNDWIVNCNKLKHLDDNESDIKIYDFFKNNYLKLKLFGDPRHPTPLLYYHIFVKICNHKNISVPIQHNEIIYNDFINWYKYIKLDKHNIKINSNIRQFFKIKYN